MRAQLLTSIGAAGVVVSLLVLSSPMQTTAQNGAGPVLMTPWGEPDLQGIWTVESDTPLQRPAKYTNQEFFTEAQRAELDQARGALLGNNKREERGTEADVSGAYNGVFLSVKRTGLRTSLIVDPPNGRLPPLTPEAAKIAAADRAFRLALLQSTETCRTNAPACSWMSVGRCRRSASVAIKPSGIPIRSCRSLMSPRLLGSSAIGECLV